MKIISQDLIKEIQSHAAQSKRRRKNFNFHEAMSDPINRMLNALEPDSYVRPHKHENPDKRELFILLTGKMLVVFFNEEGNITEYTTLSKQGNLGIEIPPKTFHTIIALEKGTIVFEVKDGPYEPSNDKNFPEWAPEEGHKDAENYINGILHQCKE